MPIPGDGSKGRLRPAFKLATHRHNKEAVSNDQLGAGYTANGLLRV